MTTKNRTTSEIFDRHPHVCLAFSGGKDSLTLLHLCRPWKDQVTVLWASPAPYPFMRDWVLKCVEGWDFKELRSDQVGYISNHGYPADTVGAFAGASVTNSDGTRRKIPLRNAWIKCCAALKGEPVYDYARLVGNPILYGQKWIDGAPLHEGVFNGVEMLWPLNDWTDDQVFEYLNEHQIELPPQYPEHDSLECWNCTASRNVGKIGFLEKQYPVLAISLRETLKALGDNPNET